MTWNFKRELARKFIHILSILILLIYFFVSENFSSKIALLLLVLLLIIFLEFEYLRIELRRKIPIVKNIWEYVQRKKEKHGLSGSVFFLIGAILVLAVFDTKIAIAAILMTTFGDLAAALIGTRFGKHYFMKERAWEGTLAEFAVDILIGISVFILYGGEPITSFAVWILIIVMAITATLVETLVYKMDDNLLIPVFAGFNGQITTLVLRYFGYL